VIDWTKPIETVPTKWQPVAIPAAHEDGREDHVVHINGHHRVKNGGNLHRSGTRWHVDDNGKVAGFNLHIRNVINPTDTVTIERKTEQEWLDWRQAGCDSLDVLSALDLVKETPERETGFYYTNRGGQWFVSEYIQKHGWYMSFYRANTTGPFLDDSYFDDIGSRIPDHI